MVFAPHLLRDHILFRLPLKKVSLLLATFVLRLLPPAAAVPSSLADFVGLMVLVLDLFGAPSPRTCTLDGGRFLAAEWLDAACGI